MPDDYYVSQYSGEEIDALLASAGAGTVRYDAAQNLTDAQKTQARSNIEAAPAGFGLGAVSATVSNADDAVINGWYKIPAPTGFGAGQLWCMVSTLASTYITQTLYTDYGNGSVAMRFNIDGTWQPWEWVNPPMQLGVEYRTTERYLGKPVYVKLVDCGALPNATTKIVEYGDSVCRPIFGYGISTNGNTFPSVNYGGGLAESFNSSRLISLWLNGNAVLIACGGDRSTINAYVFVKYWKTTD